MKRTQLAVLVGGLLAGAAMAPAHAHTTLYGQVDLSIDSRDQDGGDEDINMNSNRSAIGVAGEEDLGNGLKGIFQFEFEVDADDSRSSPSSFNESEFDVDEEGSDGVNDTFNGRDLWLGLQGGFGKLRLGQISTVYKEHNAMIDPLYRTSLDARNFFQASGANAGTGEEGQGRATNTIRYDLPDLYGFNFSGHYTLDNDEEPGEENDNPFGAGVHWRNDMFLAFADYVSTDSSGNDEAYKVGGMVNLAGFGIYGQYEFDKGLISDLSGTPGDAEDADVWRVGVSYRLGGTMLYASYGQTDEAEDVEDESDLALDSFTIAAMHNLSKRTAAYVGYNLVEIDDDDSDDDDDIGADGAEQDFVSLGIRHKF